MRGFNTTICSFILLASAALAQGQPMITGSPVNAASYVLAGLPNANIAQGSMFVLFGNNIGPAKLANAFSYPLPITLGATSIQITVNGTATDAIMLFAVSSQVAAILPSTTPTGSGTLTLTFNGETSNTVPIHVIASTLGIFTRNQSGSGPGVLFNFNSQSDQPLNSLVQAAHPGQVLTLWGTGLGAVIGQEANGPLPGNLNVPVTVYVGTKQVTPTYKGRSGCCAGIDQIVFTVPEGVEGCYVSVNVVAGGVISNSATIAVTSNGTICSDPSGFSTSDLQKVQNGGALTIGLIELDHIHAKFSSPAGVAKGSLDLGRGVFRQYATNLDILASTLGSVGAVSGLPSAGSCTVTPYSYTDFFSSIFPGNPDLVNFVGLDAGPTLNLVGPLGKSQLPRQNIGNPGQPFYRYHVKQNIIGGGIPGILPVIPAFLGPGDYSADDGPGGTQVGTFKTMLTIPSSSFGWTNEGSVTTALGQDLTVKWTGGVAGELVGVFGSSADPGTGAGAAFQCVTQAENGSFTVPAWVLSALPVSKPAPMFGVPVAFLAVGITQPPIRFQAPGIDIGFFNWASLEVENVLYQ